MLRTLHKFLLTNPSDLADPDGDFIEVIGREHTADKGAKLVTDHIGDWEGPIDRS